MRKSLMEKNAPEENLDVVQIVDSTIQHHFEMKENQDLKKKYLTIDGKVFPMI